MAIASIISFSKNKSNLDEFVAIQLSNYETIFYLQPVFERRHA